MARVTAVPALSRPRSAASVAPVGVGRVAEVKRGSVPPRLTDVARFDLHQPRRLLWLRRWQGHLTACIRHGDISIIVVKSTYN